jgi:hypothetical protein
MHSHLKNKIASLFSVKNTTHLSGIFLSVFHFYVSLYTFIMGTKYPKSINKESHITWSL